MNCIKYQNGSNIILIIKGSNLFLNFWITEIFKCYMGGLTQQHLEIIIGKISTSYYTDIFIDSSQLGYIAKVVRKNFPDLRIYTFFQNMEYDFISSSVWDGKDFLHAFKIPMTKYNERCACRYSDKNDIRSWRFIFLSKWWKII